MYSCIQELIRHKIRFKNVILFVIFTSIASCTTANFLPSCAVLRSIQNDSLILKDGSVFGNLAEEFLSADKSWNITGTWTVSPSCELKSCTEAYLNGKCTTFSGGASSSSNVWSSAQCKCNTDCACPSDFIQQSVCARAYLQPEGCRACYAAYTELNSGSYAAFSEVWADKVSSILVRSGCTITVFEDEEHDGESESITGPQVKDWTGTVGSYECTCNEVNQNSNTQSTQTSAFQNVNVPESLDGVVEQLAINNFNHPGLLASLSSLTHGRSAKNVYLLLIGSSGAGKSSAINILLGKNVTAAGDVSSTTSEILEFRIPLPVPELGIANSELRIIDTPGLGDTRGLQNDALFLATLDHYLINHEELKTKIPNLVLIFHKIDDNRFHGEGARFVRMVRGLDVLRPRITDEHYSNVLFVFSHLSSIGKDLRENPSHRLMKFKEAVEMFSFFPKPIMTVAIENKGTENELVMRNGNFELPNKEYYPQNLLDKFDTITLRTHDKMGNAVVNTNIIRNHRFQTNFNMTLTSHPMVNLNHNKVPKYLNILTSAAYTMNSSEVSNLLTEASNSMSTALKSRFPHALENLQRYLNLKNVKSKTDVPQTSKAILELISGIDQNEAISYLQETGLNLKAPVFPSNTITGFSFDILKNALLTVSPFKLDNRRSSSIGFLLPNILRCTKISPTTKPEVTFNVFDSKQNYYQHISKSLLGTKFSSVANSTEVFTSLTSKLQEGNFVKDMTCHEANNKHCFSVTRLYKTFQFELNSPSESVELQTAFVSRVRNLAPFNESSHDSVEEWSTFFNDFGTHVVKSAYGGGRIDIHFTISNQVPAKAAVEKVLKSFDFAEDPLESLLSFKESSKAIFSHSASVNHTLIFRGGNQAYHVSDVSKLSLEEASKIMSNWRKSLQFYPAVFANEITPMGEVVGNYFPASEKAQISEKIETAFSRLLTATLKFVAPTPDPKVVEELKRQQKENEERLKQLELEKKKREEEAEKQRLKEIEERRRREQQEFEALERRRKAEQEAVRERERQAELQRQRWAAEQERQRREREEADKRHRQYLAELAEQERRRREHLEWVRREQERIWEQNRRRNSCLKKGTKILMADFTEKSVELLKIGDMLLDKDLHPTRLLGLSYEFLLTQKFHAFDNKTFFFTDTHLFAGSGNNNDNEASIQFYTTSTASLFAQNPLMQYLNVTEFGDSSSGESTKLLYFDTKMKRENQMPIQKEVTVFHEYKIYPADTPIYFIQVDSPSGTYFAEGFLCRHEIPPLSQWPNTMTTLFALFGTSGFQTVGKMPYSIETIHFNDKISENTQKSVLNALTRKFLPSNDTNNFERVQEINDCPIQTFEDSNSENIISKIFSNPTLADLSMEIYGGSGSIISKFLDNSSLNLTNCRVQEIQSMLLHTIQREIELALRTINRK